MRLKKPTSAAAGDVVQLSGGTPDVAELANIAKASETANPRLEGMRQKVESGYYNTPEALDQVAGAVIDSGRVTDVAAVRQSTVFWTKSPNLSTSGGIKFGGGRRQPATPFVFRLGRIQIKLSAL